MICRQERQQRGAGELRQCRLPTKSVSLDTLMPPLLHTKEHTSHIKNPFDSTIFQHCNIFLCVTYTEIMFTRPQLVVDDDTRMEGEEQTTKKSAAAANFNCDSMVVM